jgi:hypothetical protein
LNGVTVHKRLAKNPLPRLEDVAREFFEKILGQKMSEEPVRVVSAKLVYTK